jgi:hypothetical protein
VTTQYDSRAVGNKLVIQRAGSVIGDYYGQMNSGNLGDWGVKKVMAFLLPHSVIVLDNTF